jgi:hypothetical protein
MTLALVKSTRTTSLAKRLMESPKFILFVQKLARAQAHAEAREQIEIAAATRKSTAESRNSRIRRSRKKAPKE